MFLDKYPRTPHFPFSKAIQNDDKILKKEDFDNFLKEEYVLLEKYDGQNNCFKEKLLYARSHQTPTKHEWDSYLSNLCYKKDFNENYYYFFENLFAIHSIKYTNLSTYVFLINIYDKVSNKMLSWEDIEKEGLRLGIKTPKVIFKGYFKNLDEYKNLMEKQIKLGSSEGGECEGFIARPCKEFDISNFTKVVGKFVRENHVQTDKHWSKKWEKASIVKDI